MLKKTIPFNDLDGNPVTEDFYFNLTKAEALELNFSHKGGIEEHAKRIVEAKDMAQLIALFKELLLKTVGRRSEDGRRFLKNQEITDDFTQTEAYSEMFIQLASDAEFAIQFMKGIMPADIQQEIEKSGAIEKAFEVTPSVESSTEPSWVTEGRVPTDTELRNATPDQLRLAFQRRQSAPESVETTLPLA